MGPDYENLIIFRHDDDDSDSDLSDIISESFWNAPAENFTWKLDQTNISKRIDDVNKTLQENNQCVALVDWVKTAEYEKFHTNILTLTKQKSCSLKNLKSLAIIENNLEQLKDVYDYYEHPFSGTKNYVDILQNITIAKARLSLNENKENKEPKKSLQLFTSTPIFNGVKEENVTRRKVSKPLQCLNSNFLNENSTPLVSTSKTHKPTKTTPLLKQHENNSTLAKDIKHLSSYLRILKNEQSIGDKQNKSKVKTKRPFGENKKNTDVNENIEISAKSNVGHDDKDLKLAKKEKSKSISQQLSLAEHFVESEHEQNLGTRTKDKTKEQENLIQHVDIHEDLGSEELNSPQNTNISNKIANRNSKKSHKCENSLKQKSNPKNSLKITSEIDRIPEENTKKETKINRKLFKQCADEVTSNRVSNKSEKTGNKSTIDSKRERSKYIADAIKLLNDSSGPSQSTQKTNSRKRTQSSNQSESLNEIMSSVPKKPLLNIEKNIQEKSKKKSRIRDYDDDDDDEPECIPSDLENLNPSPSKQNRNATQKPSKQQMLIDSSTKLNGSSSNIKNSSKMISVKPSKTPKENIEKRGRGRPKKSKETNDDGMPNISNVISNGNESKTEAKSNRKEFIADALNNLDQSCSYNDTKLIEKSHKSNVNIKNQKLETKTNKKRKQYEYLDENMSNVSEKILINGEKPAKNTNSPSLNISNKIASKISKKLKNSDFLKKQTTDSLDQLNEMSSNPKNSLKITSEIDRIPEENTENETKTNRKLFKQFADEVTSNRVLNKSEETRNKPKIDSKRKHSKYIADAIKLLNDSLGINGKTPSQSTQKTNNKKPLMNDEKDIQEIPRNENKIHEAPSDIAIKERISNKETENTNKKRKNVTKKDFKRKLESFEASPPKQKRKPTMKQIRQRILIDNLKKLNGSSSNIINIAKTISDKPSKTSKVNIEKKCTRNRKQPKKAEQINDDDMQSMSNGNINKEEAKSIETSHKSNFHTEFQKFITKTNKERKQSNNKSDIVDENVSSVPENPRMNGEKNIQEISKNGSKIPDEPECLPSNINSSILFNKLTLNKEAENIKNKRKNVTEKNMDEKLEHLERNPPKENRNASKKQTKQQIIIDRLTKLNGSCSNITKSLKIIPDKPLNTPKEIIERRTSRNIDENMSNVAKKSLMNEERDIDQKLENNKRHDESVSKKDFNEKLEDCEQGSSKQRSENLKKELKGKILKVNLERPNLSSMVKNSGKIIADQPSNTQNEHLRKRPSRMCKRPMNYSQMSNVEESNERKALRGRSKRGKRVADALNYRNKGNNEIKSIEKRHETTAPKTNKKLVNILRSKSISSIHRILMENKMHRFTIGKFKDLEETIKKKRKLFNPDASIIFEDLH